MADTLLVFTWREGLLSRVGHDLRLSAQRIEIVPESGGWVVRVPVAGLRVDGAMRDGALDPGALSAKDRGDIEEPMRGAVLHADQHPAVVYRGRLVDGRAVGMLTLCGRTLPLELPTRVGDGRVRGEVELVPSRWGIQPYRALLGTLKVQDRVRVVFDVALPAA
jgi:hypothetical protein